MPNIDDHLACPSCGASFQGNHCNACGLTFPVIDEVPWFVAAPDSIQFEWKNRWQMALAQLEAQHQKARSALNGTASEAARERLSTLSDGYAAQQRALKLLLKSLGLIKPAALETYQALKTRLPTQLGLTAYTANVFRDWCWGDAENAASLSALREALGDAAPARVLVLGAGAGRLAWDLHNSLTEAATVALELNPYLTTVLSEMAAGRSLTLMEFPLAPASGAKAAVSRELKAPGPTRPGFQVMLADAMRAPFQAGSFDLVVTPWLLDVIDADTAAVCAEVNRLLAPGGRWLYHGSLAFQRPDPAENLSLRELEELIAATGFRRLRMLEVEQPYLDCPDSRHGRRESVLTLCAEKTDDIKVPAAEGNLPDWIAQTTVPIPALPAFQQQAMATRVHAFIMALIDGERSLEDMAAIMEAQQLMPKEEAQSAIRGFLIKMYDEAQSGQGL
ncbi:MAG: class I SAM-dependent methyltransferase [Pseudomonadota bacterium]